MFLWFFPMSLRKVTGFSARLSRAKAPCPACCRPNNQSPQSVRSMVLLYVLTIYPICSMCGIFTTVCPKNHPNVSKYSIHGASGYIYKYVYIYVYICGVNHIYIYIFKFIVVIVTHWLVLVLFLILSVFEMVFHFFKCG